MMLRFICLFLAGGILSTEAMHTYTPKALHKDVSQFMEIPCPNSPWIDFAYFYLSEEGYGNSGCDYYMELDLRTEVEEFCKRSPGPCSFKLAEVLGQEPDHSCVSSFDVGYLCF